ncbi:IclR family transcriptional regulator [Bacillus sp. Marseille-P3661]|uniref:IclR family transcriptional regulator n=1 Tax=Bacillus sp. Marseille-P3661 TaxID=1936234 RepID=UPI000C818683|nr:IclR family transcriptional regulator [Bacillus sp. Marseille-P3661]
MRYPSLRSDSLSSMRNALRLLNLFTMDEPELTLSEIAGKLEVGISTAFRLTSTLMHEDFLTKDSVSKKFRLGASILGYGNIIVSQNQLYKASAVPVEKLAIATGESSHIAILKENQTIYLNKIDSKHPVHLLSHAGKQNPVHCTSSGQVILAYQSESLIEKVIEKGLSPYTKNTIISPVKFKELLITIRKQGYAMSIEEMHDNVSSIAAPIKNILGEVVGSISIAGPTSRVNSQTSSRLIKLVKNAALEVAEQLVFTRK